jgi:hypothetical protein
VILCTGSAALQSACITACKRERLLKTRVIRNSSVKIVTTVGCNTLINKTLHMKGSQDTQLSETPHLSLAFTRDLFSFFCRKMYFSFTWNIPAFATCAPRGACQRLQTRCPHCNVTFHRNKFSLRVGKVMCIRNFILGFFTSIFNSLSFEVCLRSSYKSFCGRGACAVSLCCVPEHESFIAKKAWIRHDNPLQLP